MFLFSYLDISFGIITLIYAAYVVWGKVGQEISRSFSFLLICVGLWSLSNGLADIATTQIGVRFLSGVALISILWFSASCLIFANNFSKKLLTKDKKLLFTVIPAFFSLLSFSRLSVSSVTIQPNIPAQITIGLLYFPSALFFITSIVASTVWLLRASKRTLAKPHARLIAISFLFQLIFCLTFDLILPLFGITTLYGAGPLSTVFIIMAVSISVFKYNIFQITNLLERLITTILVGAVLSSALCGVLAMVLVLTDVSFSPMKMIFVAISLAFLLMILARSLVHALTNLISQYFFGRHYKFEQVLNELAEVLNNTLDKQLLEKKVSEVLTKSLNASRVEIFDAEDSLVIKDNLESFDNQNKQIVCVPINLKKQTLYLYLGPKETGSLYSYKDLLLLKACSAHLVAAFERASLYDSLKSYSNQLEKRVKLRTLELANAHEEQKQAFTNIAHSLQTPLTILKIEIEKLKNQKIAKEKLGPVERSVDGVSRYIYDLLRLSRIENQTLEKYSDMKFERINLSELLGGVSEYFLTLASYQKANFTTQIEPNLFIKGNKKQIEEVVVTLLSNALKYLNKENRNISLELKREGSSVIIKVIDTGIGISKKDLKNVFKRFYRAGDEKTKGSGLGLAIVKTLVAKHNGEVLVESKENGGSTFLVRLSV